jgi:hypothetical protein
MGYGGRRSSKGHDIKPSGVGVLSAISTFGFDDVTPELHHSNGKG